MDEHDAFLKAIAELRKNEKKKFDQTVDLIINLKEFDVRREAFSTFVTLPIKIKEKRILGFFEKESKMIDSIKKEEFARYNDKKEIKKLVKNYDFFIANAKLMPAVATSFGKVLGPAGKMPSPQLGILPNEEEKMIEAMVNRINSTVRVRVKEPSIKVPIAKESFKDEDIAKNAISLYNKIVETLPRKKDNIKNIKIKFTMSKPVLVEM